MAELDTIVTEADILSQVVAPDTADLPPESARAILSLRFNQTALARMRDLAERNSRGLLNDSERAEMERYLRVGHFLDLVQAKARLSLRPTG